MYFLLVSELFQFTEAWSKVSSQVLQQNTIVDEFDS